MAYTAQPVGFLAETIQRIYDYAEEPSTNPKWTSDKLFNLMRAAYGRAMLDVNGIGQNPIIVRHDISMTPTTRTALLPPNIGRIIAFGRVDAGTGEFTEAVIPRSLLNPFGAGVSFEGNTVRFEPSWPETEELRLLYIPNGDCVMHMGTFLDTATGVATTTFPMDTTPTEGYFDRRPNGYLGSIVRLLSAVDTVPTSVSPSGYGYFPIQERPITEVAPLTGIATVDVAFDFNPASLPGTGAATVTYEIIPFLGDVFQEALAWDAAAIVLGSERRYDAKADALANRRDEMRKIRTNLAHYNTRSGLLLRSDLFGIGKWGFSA